MPILLGAVSSQKNARKLAAIWSKMVWVLNSSRELLCSHDCSKRAWIPEQTKQHCDGVLNPNGGYLHLPKSPVSKNTKQSHNKVRQTLGKIFKKNGYDFGMTGFPKWCSNFWSFRFHIEKRSSFRGIQHCSLNSFPQTDMPWVKLRVNPWRKPHENSWSWSKRIHTNT